MSFSTGPDFEVAADSRASVNRSRRRRHSARWIALVVLLVAGSFVAVLATRPSAVNQEADTPLLGKPAPVISGSTVGGGSFDLSSLRGRWVVVNFFASWCPPCQQEEPDLVAFAYQHRKPGEAALVSVVYGDTASRARSFMAQAGATWPAVEDPNGQIAIDYGVRGPPETFIVSPTGVVEVHLDGPVTDTGLDSWLTSAEREIS